MTSKILQNPDAYLTMYPSGGFSQSFPPNAGGWVDALAHARLIRGYVLALPVRRDFTQLVPNSGDDDA